MAKDELTTNTMVFGMLQLVSRRLPTHRIADEYTTETTKFQEAQIFAKLRDNGYTSRMTANLFNISRRTVDQRLQLLTLPEEAKQKVANGVMIQRKAVDFMKARNILKQHGMENLEDLTKVTVDEMLRGAHVKKMGWHTLCQMRERLKTAGLKFKGD